MQIQQTEDYKTDIKNSYYNIDTKTYNKETAKHAMISPFFQWIGGKRKRKRNIVRDK